jgi:hypothetical protein
LKWIGLCRVSLAPAAAAGNDASSTHTTQGAHQSMLLVGPQPGRVQSKRYFETAGCLRPKRRSTVPEPHNNTIGAHLGRCPVLKPCAGGPLWPLWPSWHFWPCMISASLRYALPRADQCYHMRPCFPVLAAEGELPVCSGRTCQPPPSCCCCCLSVAALCCSPPIALVVP